MTPATLLVLNAAGAFAQSNSSSTSETERDPSTRTVYGLTWGCLTTIFACTWLAIHPNVPSPKDSRWRILLRRVMIMGLTIMFPEFTTAWAFRQWKTARHISKLMSDRPEWTFSHSFFVVMGGFMLKGKRGKPRRPLLVEDLSLHMDTISIPYISEREIQDRSKGDALSKTLILFQTTWFLVQILARVVSGLPIAELELVTVGFASLNILAYAFWYHKPQNVDCAISVPVMRRLSPQEPASSIGPSIRFVDASDSPSASTASPGSIVSTHGYPPPPRRPTSASSISVPPIAEVPDIPTYVRTVQGFLSQVYEHSVTPLLWGMMQGLYPGDTTPENRGLASYVALKASSSSTLRVPTFYSGSSGEEPGYFQLFLALYFGGIHCLAWNFDFPATDSLALQWRIYAASLVGIPSYFLYFTYSLEKSLKESLSQVNGSLMIFQHSSTRLFSFVLFCGYLGARVLLATAPFILLYNPPPRVLEEVEWTKYLPHVEPFISLQ